MQKRIGLSLLSTLVAAIGCGSPPSQIPTAVAPDEVQQLELSEKEVQAEELAHRKALRMR